MNHLQGCLSPLEGWVPPPLQSTVASDETQEGRLLCRGALLQNNNTPEIWMAPILLFIPFTRHGRILLPGTGRVLEIFSRAERGVARSTPVSHEYPLSQYP